MSNSKSKIEKDQRTLNRINLKSQKTKSNPKYITFKLQKTKNKEKVFDKSQKGGNILHIKGQIELYLIYPRTLNKQEETKIFKILRKK